MDEICGNGYAVYLEQPGWREGALGLHYWIPDWQPLPFVFETGRWTDEDLENLPGHWAVIDLRGVDPQLIVDRQRSRPLVCSKVAGRWYIADNVEALRGKIPFIPDVESAEVFRHFGHTLSSRTLLDGVFDTPAASIATLADTVTFRSYLRFSVAENPITDVEEYEATFTKALDSAIGRLIEETDGRQLVVPISAGLDSRAILTWLKRLGAQNVLAYSYGLADAPERPVSQAVAEALGFPFEFVEYTASDVRDAWATSESNEYQRASWGGTSLPHKQDWYAVRQLKASGKIQEDAVVLPGHTVPAAAAGKIIYESPRDLDVVGAQLASTAGSQQGQPGYVVNHPVFRDALQEAAEQVGFGEWERDNLNLWQWFSLRERQAKFISNSVRVYENFDLGWALPLHEPEVWDARLSGSDELTLARSGYRKMIENKFAEVASFPVPVGVPPMPEARRSLWAMTVGRTRFARPLERFKAQAFGTRRQVPSPFATESYAPRMSVREWFGRNPNQTRNGRAADAMLMGQTGMGYSLFDAGRTIDIRQLERDAKEAIAEQTISAK